MMLDDINADETYEKIKRRVMGRKCFEKLEAYSLLSSRTPMMMILTHNDSKAASEVRHV